MLRIVIRADAGTVPEIGTGHVVRAIKLANALSESNAFQELEILFATREAAPYELGAKLVRNAGYKIIDNTSLEPNSNLELQSILFSNPRVVIFDRLETSADLVIKLKKNNIFVITFDDLGDGQPHADLAIHPLLQTVEPKTNTYIGYDYFFSTPNISNSIKNNPIASKVFVSFGGFDHRKLNISFLDLIPNIHGPSRYEIFVSNLDANVRYKLANMARRIKATRSLEIDIYDRPLDYHVRLCNSDLAIVSGGLTAFECAQAGIPAIGIPQYKHQLENFKNLERYGCLKLGSRDMVLDQELLSNLVSSISLDKMKRMTMSQCGLRLIDGKGLDRVVNLIIRYHDLLSILR